MLLFHAASLFPLISGTYHIFCPINSQVLRFTSVPFMDVYLVWVLQQFDVQFWARV